MKYVYCLARDIDPAATRPRGLDGGIVEEVTVGEITALVSDVHAIPVPGDVGLARIHQETVQAVLDCSSSVLPCRFGTVLQDEGSVRSLLTGRYGGIEAALLRLRGKVEVGIRVLVDAEASVPRPAATEGRDDEEGGRQGEIYLLARRLQLERTLALREQATRIRRGLDEATTPFWVDVKAAERTTPKGLLLSVSYLVERDRLPSFEGAYGAFQAERTALKLLFSGPWPPYSFAEPDVPSPSGVGMEG